MNKRGWKSIAVFVAFALFMGMAGTALAWQYNQYYTPSTLYGGANGKSWSPNSGWLEADVYNPGSGRQTNPVGYNVWWNPTAVNYIKNNGQWVSITFHSFDINNGCSSFATTGNGGTNLPAPRLDQYRRQCLPFGNYTEARLVSTNASTLAANTYYWGQAIYQDNNTTGVRQKVTVDTYYGNSENWHQTYCIDPGAYTARVCP